MTKERAQPPETKPSAEALDFAETLTKQLEQDLAKPPTLQGLAASDRSTLTLWQWDQERQAKVSPRGYVYFGHTVKIDSYLYKSLLSGYAPSKAQLATKEHDWDFMWDEILELYSEHPDIAQTLDTYGYGTTDPVAREAISFVGSHALPRQVLVDMFGTLYDRGKSYREWGWGYPSWGDDIPEQD